MTRHNHNCETTADMGLTLGPADTQMTISRGLLNTLLRYRIAAYIEHGHLKYDPTADKYVTVDGSCYITADIKPHYDATAKAYDDKWTLEMVASPVSNATQDHCKYEASIECAILAALLDPTYTARTADVTWTEEDDDGFWCDGSHVQYATASAVLTIK